MNNVLVLSFIVEDGSKFNITVTDPKPDLSEDEIRAAIFYLNYEECKFNKSYTSDYASIAINVNLIM